MPRKTVNGKKSTTSPKVDATKKKLMKALEESLGNISVACKACKLSRETFYKYYDKDENFRKHADECREIRLDFAEHKLNELIEQQNPTAIIFLLKTIGKKRGYSEQTNIDITSKDEKINNTMIPINVIINDNSPEKDPNKIKDIIQNILDDE